MKAPSLRPTAPFRRLAGVVGDLSTRLDADDLSQLTVLGRVALADGNALRIEFHARAPELMDSAKGLTEKGRRQGIRDDQVLSRDEAEPGGAAENSRYG
jgi:hypothetical protein